MGETTGTFVITCNRCDEAADILLYEDGHQNPTMPAAVTMHSVVKFIPHH